MFGGTRYVKLSNAIGSMISAYFKYKMACGGFSNNKYHSSVKGRLVLEEICERNLMGIVLELALDSLACRVKD